MSLLAFYFSHSAADIISNFRVDCLLNLTQTYLKMLGGGGGEGGGEGRSRRKCKKKRGFPVHEIAQQ